MPTIEGSLRRIWTFAGVPVDGVAGTYINQILPGDLLVDTTNKTLYQNTGTSASPTYTLKASSGASLAVLAAEMAANGTGVANVLGISAAAAPIDHVHKIGTHDHSDSTKGGTLALGGASVAVVAPDAVVPGIPMIFPIAVASGAAAVKEIAVTFKYKVVSVWARHTGGGGEAGDTITIGKGAAAITDAMSWAGADNTVVQCASINDTNNVIDGGAGEKLRVTTTDSDGGGDVGAGVVNVMVIRVA